MEYPQDSEDYWSNSARKAFNFDEEETNINAIEDLKWDILSDNATFENNEPEAINILIKDVISDESLNAILQEQSLSECIISKGMALENEIKLLRRQIQTTLHNPAPEATATKLLQGKNPPLEVFKSIDDKLLLLDKILEDNGGGDAVLGVLLFLKRTLNQKNFIKVLKERPKALEHFTSYLKSVKQHKEEAFEILEQFGRHQNIFVIRFCDAMNCNDVDIRKNKLKLLIESFNINAGDINELVIQIAQNAFKLLNFIQTDRNTLDNVIDNNSTPIEVLYACCNKYANWKEDGLTCNVSPYRLSYEQKISSAQFEWTALNERATSQAYADLESIFERFPTWHRIKQKQFHISFSLESAVLRLHALKAPASVLYLFLSKMNDSSEKLQLSQQVHCIKAAIDALSALKNIHQLMKLKEKLPDRSEEHFYCEKALKSLQNKRWSTDNIKIKL